MVYTTTLVITVGILLVSLANLDHAKTTTEQREILNLLKDNENSLVHESFASDSNNLKKGFSSISVQLEPFRVDEDKFVDLEKVGATSSSPSSPRTLTGLLGDFLSARDIDRLSTRRNINVNVLSNINVADIIRAYRGESDKPKAHEESKRSRRWF